MGEGETVAQRRALRRVEEGAAVAAALDADLAGDDLELALEIRDRKLQRLVDEAGEGQHPVVRVHILRRDAVVADEMP